MDYELAKELKDAGFPQHFTGECDSGCNIGNPDNTDFVYEPTLSELIEACGEEFDTLKRDYQDVPFGAPGKWLACISSDRGETASCFVEDTALESVAHMWLSLNKNHEKNNL